MRYFGRRSLCLLTAALFTAAGACAQSDSTGGETRSQTEILEHDALRMLHGAGYVFTSPLRWDAHDWLLAGGVAATGAATSLLDRKTAGLMDRNRTPLNDGIQRVAVNYGDGFVIFGVAGAGYLSGLYFDLPWLRETAMLTGTAVLLAGTVSTVTKVVVGRARPFTGLGNGRFRPFTLDDAYHAFPSGHTIAAFSVSTVLSERIHNCWATGGLYTVATVSAMSRSYSREHWLSDIVVAALYSSAMAHTLVAWYEGRQPETSGFRMVPVPGGVAFVYRF